MRERMLVGLVVLLSACQGPGAPEYQVAVRTTYSELTCEQRQAIRSIMQGFRDGEPVHQGQPGPCSDAPVTIEAKAEDLTVTAGGLNANDTLCYTTVDAPLPTPGADGVAVVDLPAAEPDCEADATCPDHVPAMNPLYQLALELRLQSLAFCSGISPIVVALLLHSNGVLTRPPAGNHLEGVRRLALRITLAQLLLHRVITTPTPNATLLLLYRFALGGAGLGLGFKPGRAAPVDPPPGDYLVFAQVLKGPLPEADPANHYQYAFVFDADGVTTNNYQPSPSFPADFFKDTDRWYELLYTPTGGWTTKVSTAIDSVIEPATSAAQIYALGNVVFLLVPASEFAVPSPAYRVTAFRHTGDFGLNPPNDFDGYVDPPVAMGLHTF